MYMELLIIKCIFLNEQVYRINSSSLLKCRTYIRDITRIVLTIHFHFTLVYMSLVPLNSYVLTGTKIHESKLKIYNAITCAYKIHHIDMGQYASIYRMAYTCHFEYFSNLNS